MALLENLRAADIQTETGISHEQLPEGQNAQEVSTSARAKNLELANKIASDTFKKQGIDESKVRKGINLAQVISSRSTDFLSNNEDAIARDLFAQKYQRQATTDELANFKSANDSRIQDSLYDSLAGNAKELGMDLSKDPFYSGYVARTVAKNTPKEPDVSWGQKAGQVIKSLADTTVGTAAIVSDGLGITDNLYKDWFGDQTKLTGREGVGAKTWDLLFAQQAWVDVAFAVATLATEGLAAPVWIGAKTAAGAGLKVAGKVAFEVLEKEAVKEGTELFTKQLFKEGLEAGTKALEKNVVEGLSEKFGGEIAEKAFKAFKTGDGIMDIVRHGGEAIVGGEAKKFTGKEIADGLVASVSKEFGENLSAKGMSKLEKSLGKFSQMANTIHGVDTLTTGGKAILAGSHISSALGIPGLALMDVVPTGIKLGAEEAGKGITGALAKTGLKFDTTVMRVGLYGGLPFAGTIPGIGDWIQNNVMMVGNQVAGFAAKNLRIGVADQEKQKFIDKYGIDPDTTQDVAIKAAFEDQLNYRIRHSLPSEILTGVSYGERGSVGQATSAIIDGIANMSGLMIMHHAFNHAMGVSEKYFSPISIEHGEGGEIKITSNIDFLKSLDEIHDQYKNGQITGEQRDGLINSLKDEIQKGDTSFVKTVRSAKEMENVINETLQYINLSENITHVDSTFAEKLSQLKEKDLSQEKNMLEAVHTIEEANKQVVSYANSLFSSEHFQKLQDKTTLLTDYLKKVAESTSFINQITRPLVSNLFTSSVFSPTNAALNLNKVSVASESALSSAISIMDSILEPQKKIATLFEQKGKLYENFKNDSPYGKMLEAKITDNLKRNGYSDSDTAIITSALGKEVQMELTKVYLSFKDSGDILSLVNPVFGNFGVKLKEATAGTTGKITDVARIIQEMRGDTTQGKVTLSALVSSLMEEKFAKLTAEKGLLAEDFRRHAQELVEFDRTKSDAIARLNYEREITRNNQLSVVPTEIVEVATPQEKSLAKEQLMKQMEGATDEQKQAIKERLDAIDGDRLYKVNTPEITDTVIDGIVENSDAIKQLDHNRVENAVIKVENDVKASQMNIETAIQSTDNAILNLHLAHERVKKYLPELFKGAELPSSKDADDVVRNMVRIGSSFDIFNKSITNYSDLVKAAVDISDTINLKNVMSLNEVRNRELQKIFKESIARLGYDETMSPARSEHAKAAILRMANEAMGEIVKPLEMDTIRDMARNSESTEVFLGNVKDYLVKNIGFVPEFADKIINNSFGGAETYLYNQYRNTEKQAFVNIDSNGEVIHSTKDETPFLDANGNNTHLYRLGGLGADVMKASGAVIVDKFLKDGKEVDPFESFTKAEKGLTSRESFNQKFDSYIKVMEQNGFQYVGPFQEEGKKLIFVPSSYGAERFIKETTGVDIKLVDKLPQEYKTIIGENLAKRGKLSLWNENTPDTDTLRKNRPNRQDDNIRVLYFDDKIPVDGVNKDSFDGETFAFSHLADTLNQTIAAGKENKTWKPVLVGDKGNFVKSQASVISEAHLRDPMFQEALTKFAEKNTDTFEGLTLKDVIDTNGFNSTEGRQSIISFIEGGQIIDMMAPNSAYKNIYKGIPDDVLTKAGIEFTRPTVGDVIDFDHKKMGLKSIDFSVTPEYAKQERVTFSNQILRGLSDMSSDLSLDNKANVQAIYSLINDIKQENATDLGELISKAGEDPIGIVGQIADRFGVKYNDPNFQEFINTKNVKNVVNMLSNIMNQQVLASAKLEGNALRVRSVPQYNLVRDSINKALIEKFGEGAKDNFMILDRENYGHIARGELGDTRYMTVRYPIVGPKVVNAPHIIFTDELGKLIGDETFRPRMDDGVAISHKLMERFEGDNDGDKLYMITDPRLEPVRKNIESFVDDAFNNTSKAFTQQVTKETRAHHATDTLGIFQEAGADMFEGKKNIGKIDKQFTISDILMRMDLIDSNKKGLWNGKIVSAKEEFLGKMGELLQKSVDNQEIRVEDMFGLAKDYFTTPVDKIATSPFANTPLKNIGWETDGKKDGFFKYIEKDGRTNNGIVNSEAVGKIISSTLEAMRPEDYKMVTQEGKYGSYKTMQITNPEIISILNKTLSQYSFKNVEKQLRGVLDFVGKVDYTDNGPIPKNIQNLEESYKESKQSFDFFKDNMFIFKDDNYLFDFINKMGSNLDRFSSEKLGQMRADIQKKVDVAFRNARENFMDFGEFSDGKTTVADVKNLVNDYSRADLQGRKDMQTQFVDLKHQNPKFDLDSFIISHYNYEKIPMDLLSKAAKEQLGNYTGFFLTVGHADELYKLYPKNEVDALIGSFGTDEFEQKVSDFMERHEEFQTDYAINPAKYASIGIKAPDSIKALYQAGVSPEALTDTVKRINSMEKNDRIDTYAALANLNPEHIANALKGINDEGVITEITTALGLRDVTRKAAAEQAIEAAKNADKLYDQKLPDC